jgi:hypothetical protein
VEKTLGLGAVSALGVAGLRKFWIESFPLGEQSCRLE